MPNFNKYELYEASVSDAKSDVKLFRKIFYSIFKKYPVTYREDFCGTFLHSAEWIKLDPRNKACAIDLSLEPLKYGLKTHRSKLSRDQKGRLRILKRDVLVGTRSKFDLISAMNFSYSCLKQREVLKKYFQTAYRSLNSKGLFLIDAVGGTQLQEPSIEKRRIDWGKKKPSLIFYWEQKNFDAIQNQAKFSIHFKVGKSKRRIKNAFTYDWRLWTLPEIRELMLEVGFKKAEVYWEGTTRKGEGNDVFSKAEHQENCEVWIAYIAGIK